MLFAAEFGVAAWRPRFTRAATGFPSPSCEGGDSWWRVSGTCPRSSEPNPWRRSCPQPSRAGSGRGASSCICASAGPGAASAGPGDAAAQRPLATKADSGGELFARRIVLVYADGRLPGGLQDEDLDREIGVLVDLAHVGDHLAMYGPL